MNKNQNRFLLSVAACVPLTLALLGCDPVVNQAPPEAPTPPPVTSTPAPTGKSFDPNPFKGNGKVVKTASGLQYEEMTIGDGKEAKPGTRASVHYTGTLKDGTKFDSSRDRNEAFAFTIGAGEVIKGWDEGVAGMKVGGRRKLIIPYQLAYGEEGRPPTIPAKSELTFDVELMGVE
ncbi:MAG: FKBP-type peptidyl-prolyl cis-trans isomerase [Armatimonadota bacterium]